MGRRKNRGGGGGGAGKGWKPGQRADYKDITKTNENFERYYNAVGIISESEREDFWAAMRRELPSSFRFTGSKGHALTVQKRLIEHYIPKIIETQFNGESVSPPQPVKWYPNNLAWSMTTPKNIVRRMRPFQHFQKFLVSETTAGNISRQELVSMVPPLLLDVRPGHVVLDLCAAPGSKTAQLIEMLHAGEEARVRKVLRDAVELQRAMSPDGLEAQLDDASGIEDDGDDGRATGLLVANDVDYKRAQLLVHQTKRLNSPNLVVTNHDASLFPSIRIPSEGKTEQYLKFDRILADVPCTGDGTTRKNYAIWKDWSPNNSIGLHPMQVRILVRAIQMLKVGGRAVYSTCSLNPVENEAVVATAIEQCGGNAKVRLVDCSKELPDLIRRKGLRDWKLMDTSKSIWPSWSEYVAAKGEGGEHHKIKKTMFARTETDEASRIPLENCLRIFPHLQDTGGFFVAVLEKLDPVAAILSGSKHPRDEEAVGEDEEDSKRIKSDDQNGGVLAASDIKAEPKPGVQEENAEDTKHIKDENQNGDMVAIPEVKAEPAPGLQDETDKPSSDIKKENGADPIAAVNAIVKKKKHTQAEEFFEHISPDHAELLAIYKYYELPDRFPRDRWMVRNASGEPVKAIYYTTALVRDILRENKGRGMKFVQCGVRMFQKQEAQGQLGVCRWRIQSEGLPIIEPWVGETRVIRVFSQKTLHILLKEMFPKIAHQTEWERFGEISETLRDIPMGCAVLRVEVSDKPDGFKQRMVFPLWRSIASINMMLPKEERKAALLRLYDDESPLIDHSQQGRDKNRAASAESADAGDAKAETQGVAADQSNGAEVVHDTAAEAGGQEPHDEADDNTEMADLKPEDETNHGGESPLAMVE